MIIERRGLFSGHRVGWKGLIKVAFDGAAGLSDDPAITPQIPTFLHA